MPLHVALVEAVILRGGRVTHSPVPALPTAGLGERRPGTCTCLRGCSTTWEPLAVL